MVNTFIENQELSSKHKMQAKGQHRYHRRQVKISFTIELFEQISKEALRREWGFSHMVRHLCEASIEGIE